MTESAPHTRRSEGWPTCRGWLHGWLPPMHPHLHDKGFSCNTVLESPKDRATDTAATLSSKTCHVIG